MPPSHVSTASTSTSASASRHHHLSLPPIRSSSSLYPSLGSNKQTKMSGHREGASKSGSLGSFNLRSVKTGGKEAQNDDCIAVNVLLERWERRKTQNRLAQRKFREKAKESLSRDAENQLHGENQLHAGNSYTIPDSDDLGLESELSGLPWGGLSMRHIVKRSKATQGGSNMA